MQTLSITISNEQNTAFLVDLLRKFDFVTDIKIKSPKTETKQADFEKHLGDLKEKYNYLPITWASQKPTIEDFTSILSDRKLSLNEIREKAWKRK